MPVELNVDDGADDLDEASLGAGIGGDGLLNGHIGFGLVWSFGSAVRSICFQSA
jgi:hypothetical protein